MRDGVQRWLDKAEATEPEAQSKGGIVGARAGEFESESASDTPSSSTLGEERLLLHKSAKGPRARVSPGRSTGPPRTDGAR